MHKALCFITLSLGFINISYAIPVSEQTAQQFFNLVDQKSIIYKEKSEANFYHQYALERVSTFLKTDQPLNKAQIQAVEDIEKLYSSLDDERLKNIKDDSLITYQNLFKEFQNEESVRKQIDFMLSKMGQSILLKQKSRQNDILELYRGLPTVFAKQLDVQDLVRNALNK